MYRVAALIAAGLAAVGIAVAAPQDSSDIPSCSVGYIPSALTFIVSLVRY